MLGFNEIFVFSVKSFSFRVGSTHDDAAEMVEPLLKARYISSIMTNTKLPSCARSKRKFTKYRDHSIVHVFISKEMKILT